MSISALAYTPNILEAKDIASKIGYGKQITGYDGADLGTPDTFGQLPLLKEFLLQPSFSPRTDVLWNDEEYTLGSTETAEVTMSVVSRLKAVVQDLANAVKGNLYLFLVEQMEEAVAGMYQIAGFMGEFTGFPAVGKDPTKEFAIKPGKAVGDVVVDLNAAAADLDQFAQTLGLGASLTIPNGKFYGLYEAAWA